MDGVRYFGALGVNSMRFALFLCHRGGGGGYATARGGEAEEWAGILLLACLGKIRSMIE